METTSFPKTQIKCHPSQLEVPSRRYRFTTTPIDHLNKPSPLLKIEGNIGMACDHVMNNIMVKATGSLREFHKKHHQKCTTQRNKKKQFSWFPGIKNFVNVRLSIFRLAQIYLSQNLR